MCYPRPGAVKSELCDAWGGKGSGLFGVSQVVQRQAAAGLQRAEQTVPAAHRAFQGHDKCPLPALAVPAPSVSQAHITLPSR